MNDETNDELLLDLLEDQDVSDNGVNGIYAYVTPDELEGIIQVDNNNLVNGASNIPDENFDDRDNPMEQDQAELRTNNDDVNMHSLDNCQKSERISSISDEHYINESQDSTVQHDQFVHSLTTDGSDNRTTYDETQIDLVTYTHQFFEKANLVINKHEPSLKNLVISATTANSYLKDFQMPLLDKENLTASESLNELIELFQTGINLLSSFRQRCNSTNDTRIDPVGQELNETSDRNVSAPNEPSIQQDIQVSPSTISKENPCESLSSSLTQLFANAQTTVEDLRKYNIEIVNQPKPYWKNRTINCLKKKQCPAIQGREEKQRNYIRIKCTKIEHWCQGDLFVLAQLLSYDGKPHSSKVIVPAKTKVQPPTSRSIRPKPTDLIIDNSYGFDFENRSILIPTAQKNHVQFKTDLPIFMFSLYQTTDNEEIDRHETNMEEYSQSIESELHKLCKVRICLCHRTKQGELQIVSNAVCTSYFEESKGTKDLAITSIYPANQLCKCGNEKITVQLNTDSEKNGFAVYLNNEALEIHKVHGITNKQLSFKSIPPKTHDQNALHVKITKKNILETIEEGHNPYDGIIEKILLEVNYTYVDYSANPHEHK